MIPSECPNCGEITGLNISTVPPEEHDRTADWETRIECGRCGHTGWPEL